MSEFIRRQPSKRTIIFRAFFCFLILFFCSYFILSNTSFGNDVQQWWMETKLKLQQQYDGDDDATTISMMMNDITRDEMKPLFVRDLIVETKSGRLRGFVQSVSGIEIGTFLSIPYGEAPVDKRRFRATIPIEPWNGERDATQIPPPCIQSEYTQRLFPVHIMNENLTEDCLYMNIWTPVTNLSDPVAMKRQPKSVMILIHGGLFTIGSIGIDEYDGRMLAAIGDVIVVTVQYRLGIFGFLDLDTEQIPGNMGLMDQYTAIRWISDNIERFGGNPQSITLFGTSAGSISIGFHMFSTRANRLFQRAILQSGSPMLIKQVFTRGEMLAERFAKMIGCYNPHNRTTKPNFDDDDHSSSIFDEPESIVQCIDRTPFETIYRAQGELVENNPIPFMPTIPSDYIEQFINDYNESTSMEQKEIMIGFNMNEGALMLHAAYPKIYTRHTVPPYRTLKEVQKRVIEMGVDSGLNENQASTIATLLIRGKEVDTPLNWATVISNLFSDIMFICPTYEFANKLHQYNLTTYMYRFGQRASNSQWGEWMNVTHHDEIGFIMGYPLRYPRLSNYNDRLISEKMIKTWSHFAKTGEIASNEYSERWQPYQPYQKQFMRIEANSLRMGYNFHNESCDLYNLLSEYMN
ncbi:hypothetical protein RDWZM_009953 [Blomia tropicalis]|uniref:Carboxylic ester hydrolase n=1 Tax=Blomia tropicalis TaxID=40697 RepID=A0A9Q0RH95_BLOTA|nr:hypothetical protein RDWZM_009953 [Blomia tropicalis]